MNPLIIIGPIAAIILFIILYLARRSAREGFKK